MPKIAAFPKAWLDNLCVRGDMTVAQWVDMAAPIGADGLEFYAGFLELSDATRWPEFRKRVEDRGMSIPMLCCSPDFTHPDPAFRAEQVAREKGWIDMAAALGTGFCRVLSGQRRPEVTREEGIGYAVECIEACIPHAADHGVTLIIENHYKDNVWIYPEFAQQHLYDADVASGLDSPR